MQQSAGVANASTTFLKRNASLAVSRSSVSRKTSIFFGALIIIWGGCILYLAVRQPLMIHFGIHPYAIVGLACALLFFGFSFLMVKAAVYPQTNRLMYSPITNIWKNLKTSFGLALFSVPFTYVFYYVSKTSSTAYIGVVIGSLFVFISLYSFYRTVKEFILFLKYDVSTLQVDKSVIRFGDTIHVTFQNEKISRRNMDLFFVLRNIKEIWAANDKGDQSSRQLRFQVLHEEQKKGKSTSAVSFTIPWQHGEYLPTHLDVSEPSYWEIEVSNKELNFFSTFLLTIHSQY